MKTLCVIQHTEAEYLGLIEDHLEGRNLRFQYRRPFTADGFLPKTADPFDGLMLMGGGPYGIVSGHILPSLGHELRLTAEFLAQGKPVVGFGLGALVLAVAAGGGAQEAPLRFEVTEALAQPDTALGAALPARFPLACYLRDRPVIPKDGEVVLRDAAGAPLGFTVGGNSLGMLGHPGFKRGMAEDLIMEFAETPEHTVEGLRALGDAQQEIADALSQIMVGMINHTGLM